MGKGKRKIDTRGPLQRRLDSERSAAAQSYLDVITPEQLASGDYATGFDAKGRAHTTGRRYFRLSHLDRLHRNGKLTYEQHQAGQRYRELYEMGRYDSPKSADFTGLRGGNVVSFIMPTRQQQARDMWRVARLEIQRRDVGFADRFLLRDEWPARSTKQRESYLTKIRSVLDTLAVHFRYA